MSVLVGAGFSKNFDNDIFPNWWELITDMVKITEEKRIKEQFDLLHLKKAPKPGDYDTYLKKSLEDYIDKTGPLKVVSDYIKIVGFREAVDLQIEAKTPYIEVNNGLRSICYYSKGELLKIPVTDDQIGTHIKLLSLPWNNIFTTNYDNLLEKSIDIQQEEELTKKLNDLVQEIKDLKHQLDKDRPRIEEVALILEEANKSNIAIDQTGFISPSVSLKPLDEIERKNLEKEQGEVRYRIFDAESQVKTKEDDLSDINKIFGDHFTVVKHSSELALKKNGNIIKIHGSIRSEHSGDYGFDGDPRKQYIISQEDFDTYPEKHEAFTQLMRISLLQESFCLLGFSGIDPNFLAWIGWVRDIVQRKKINENESEKLYLIGVKEEAADPGKELFYKNHRIAYISLSNSDTKLFLEEKTGHKLPLAPTPKQLISLFLDYLGTDITPSVSKIGFELLQKKEYDRFWERVPRFVDQQNDQKVESIFESVQMIRQKKKYNRIPSIDYFSNRNKYFFLRSFDYYLDAFKDQKEILVKILQMADILIEDQFMPHSILFNDTAHLFPTLLNLSQKLDESIYSKFLLHDLKDAVWSNDLPNVKKISVHLGKSTIAEIIQETQYLIILSAIFNFKFQNAEKLLDIWEPVDHWIMKKAGAQSILSPEKALHILMHHHQPLIQDNLFQLEFIGYLQSSVNRFSDRKKNSQLIKSIKNEGIKSIHDYLESLLESLLKVERKVIPYGEDKFKTTRSNTLGGNNHFLDSLQYFNLLQETGFPICVPGVYLQKMEEVHLAIEKIYWQFPIPALFYLFQYSNEKFIQKMAQDYADNPKLGKTVVIIIRNLEKAYFHPSTPASYKKNGLIFMSEFINVVEPKLWERFFEKVWDQQKTTKTLFTDRRHFKNLFIEKGMHFLHNNELVGKVINDSLEGYIDTGDENGRNTIIQFLYELNANDYLTNNGNVIGEYIDEAIFDKILTGLKTGLEYLFLIGNIDFALKEATKERTRAILRTSNFDSTSERIWRIVLAYANGDKEIIARIKNEILSSDKLWNSGISETSASGNTTAYISLYQIRQFGDNKGIKWNANEQRIILDKLKNELAKIEAFLNKRGEEGPDYTSILEEMNWFLDDMANQSPAAVSQLNIRKRIKTLITHQQKADDLFKRLTSIEKATYLSAIGEVAYQLHNYRKFEKIDPYLPLILYKLIFQVEPGLAESLGYISDWAYEFRNENFLNKYDDLLEEIVFISRQKRPADIDLPFLEEKTVKLAYVLNKWGNKNPIILQTIGLLKKSRFNNVKFNLSAFLST